MYKEKIEKEGTVYAYIIRANDKIEGSRFVTDPNDPHQLGMLSWPKGHIELPHKHRKMDKVIKEVHEVLGVVKGIIEVDFYDEDKNKINTTSLSVGDTMLLAEGIHRIRIIEDAKGIKVKQGPYRGIEQDKEIVNIEEW